MASKRELLDLHHKELLRTSERAAEILKVKGRAMYAKDVGRAMTPPLDAVRASAALRIHPEVVHLPKRPGSPARWAHRLWLPTIAATSTPRAGVDERRATPA